LGAITSSVEGSDDNCSTHRKAWNRWLS
jgi:hypothetical protein